MCIKVSGKNVNFDRKKIKKVTFYKNKKVVKIDDIDINKILVSKEEPYGIKVYWIQWLQQMTGYAKKFEFNLTMLFKIRNSC